jgi:hypothetical protein
MTKTHTEDPAPPSECPANAVSHPSMLRSIKQLYGHSLDAADGKIGTIKDFYFDDRPWAVRYVVVATRGSSTG